MIRTDWVSFYINLDCFAHTAFFAILQHKTTLHKPKGQQKNQNRHITIESKIMHRISQKLYLEGYKSVGEGKDNAARNLNILIAFKTKY